MPNVAPAKYTVQLGPTVTPEVAAELATWGELLGMSNSAVARECIEQGLSKLRRKWTREVCDRLAIGTGDAGAQRFEEVYGERYAAHLEHFQGRGDRQTSRRRAYDERTRHPEGERGAA